MKRYDKTELMMAVALGAVALAGMFFVGDIPLPISAGIISLGATGCFFFAASFSQRKINNKAP